MNDLKEELARTESLVNTHTKALQVVMKKTYNFTPIAQVPRICPFGNPSRSTRLISFPCQAANHKTSHLPPDDFFHI